MKKYFSLFLAFLLCLSLCACGKTDIRDALRGEWSYSLYSIDGICYKIYDFDKDGTVKVSWINTGNSKKSTSDNGVYKIKSDTIVITENGGSGTVIEYIYQDGVLALFDVGPDGSMNRQLKRN